MKFKLIEAYSYDKFTQQVKECIDRGYIFQGGVSISKGPYGVIRAVLMVKPQHYTT